MNQPGKTSRDRIEEILEQGRRADDAERLGLLHELIDRFQETPEDEVEARRRMRQAFLSLLEPTKGALTEERVVAFLAEQVRPDDFTGLSLKSPDDVLTYSEMLYSFQYRNKKMAQQIQAHMNDLLRHALHAFEENQAYEKMFELLRSTPVSPEQVDLEMQRLRNRVYLYEMQRIRRNRRWLFSYLGLYVVLVVLVFPFLFINAENGWIQAQIEETAKVDLPEERRQFLSYNDGLYWSIITSMSIGYGDITPHTTTGRVIAMILAVMGVITIGVIAGLILQWLTPRQLE